MKQIVQMDTLLCAASIALAVFTANVAAQETVEAERKPAESVEAAPDQVESIENVESATDAPTTESQGDTVVAESAAPEPEASPLEAIPVAVEEPAPLINQDERSSEPGVMRIDDIVVTAQKREERLQDVPVAITVIKQEELERANVTQITDLARLAPSVEVNGQPGNADTRISIRGISTESFSVTAEQAVSLVVDGVVLGKAPSVSLFDIGRVEILRGPQGTLFGKNSSAGAISISTNVPDPTRFSAGVRSDFGSEYGYRLLQGSINLPISQTTALRLNVGQTLTDGFIYNNVRKEDGGQNIKGARARFLWQPDMGFTLNLIADFEKQRTVEQLYVQFDKLENEQGEPIEIPDCGGVFAGPENRISCGGDSTFNNGKSWGYSAQLEIPVGEFTITSISALRRYEQYNEIDVDGLPGNYYNNANEFNNRVVSQELRLASPVDDDLKYVVGAFYSDSSVPNFLTQIIGPDVLTSLGSGYIPIGICSQLGVCGYDTVGLNQPNQYTATINSKAVFGQVTYRLFEPLRVILGARYTKDDVSMVSTNFIGLASAVPFLQNLSPLIPLNEPLLGQSKVNNLSWRAGLQYEFSKDTMAFFTASKGYKGPQVVFIPPGLIPSIGPPPVLPTPAAINIVNPEYPMDFQLGMKSTILEGLMAFNVTLFHTDIKDFQSSVFNGQASFTPNNVPNVITKGIEVDFFGYLAPGLTVTSGLLYNEVTYPSPYFVGCTQVGPECPDVEAGTVQDVGGKQLPVAPKFKITFSPEYSIKAPWGTTAFITTDIVHRTGIHFGASDDTRTKVGSRTIIGARIGFRGPDDNWEISAFGRNLTDEYNPAFLFAPYLIASGAIPNSVSAGHALSTESFRFLGVSAGVRF